MGTSVAVFSTGDVSASMRHRTIAWQRMNPTKLDDRQNHLRDVARPGRLAKVWSRIRLLTIPGVTQANISPTSLNSLLIPFPSLSPQRAMAATLNSAADTVGRFSQRAEWVTVVGSIDCACAPNGPGEGGAVGLNECLYNVRIRFKGRSDQLNSDSDYPGKLPGASIYAPSRTKGDRLLV